MEKILTAEAKSKTNTVESNLEKRQEAADIFVRMWDSQGVKQVFFRNYRIKLKGTSDIGHRTWRYLSNNFNPVFVLFVFLSEVFYFLFSFIYQKGDYQDGGVLSFDSFSWKSVYRKNY